MSRRSCGRLADAAGLRRRHSLRRIHRRPRVRRLDRLGAIGADLGFAARLKPAAGPVFAYLSEATLPVYILHHAPLLLLGTAILPLAIPAGVKIAMIFAGTSVISLGAYHWLVRPWAPVRVLMGMSAAQAAVPGAARVAQGAV